MPTTHTHTPRPRALQPIDELFRLRLALLEQDLAHRFDIYISTVSRICKTWILFLDQQLHPLITWPTISSMNICLPNSNNFTHIHVVLSIVLKYSVSHHLLLIFNL